jgi:hypothetical protein
MKKNILILVLFVANSTLLRSQNSVQKYPTPEYSNEIYFFKKDSGQLSRLEKGYSKMDTKTKAGGMGGGEYGYTLEGSKSNVRLPSGNLSFVFFMGTAGGSSEQSDSVMRANGMDPSAMSDAMGMMNDPSQTTSLYQMNVEKESRKITMQSFQGMKLLGKAKKESTKYTLSIKKVKSGYYELVVDKPLPRGEYAFLIMGSGNADGKSMLFAFGVE